MLSSPFSTSAGAPRVAVPDSAFSIDAWSVTPPPSGAAPSDLELALGFSLDGPPTPLSLALGWRFDWLLGTASVVAAVLYRDFARGRDDVTVVVLREHEEQQAATAQRSDTP